ncbi:hypothetical protein Franean1_5234 [Parafrankia sp. EAN1pec]|uniref:hypothetical protein n=1 Tax=Parafrankia sp. (strain EAN1pec) TaxID=298653 RepID=UPI0000544451|nr:hypothetical protein Franean1_5234 [Frankia sp. EAN1pec]
MFRLAVCAFDDRPDLPAETHTLDALVSAMKRRQWLSAEESLALHAVLVAIFPNLAGRAVFQRGVAGTVDRPVRKRPLCVPALLECLPTARTRPDPILDELTEALTTPAGVATDRAELRRALDSLVSRASRPTMDLPASLQQYEIHLINSVYAAQGRIAELAETAADPPAGVLWALLDAVRDGAWRDESSLASLRGSLFSQLRMPIPGFAVGPPIIAPDVDPTVLERIAVAAGEVLARLRAELADVWDGDRARAADLVVDALSALSTGVLGGGPGDIRVQPAVTRLRTLVTRAMAAAGPVGGGASAGGEMDGGGAESRADRSAAAQETIDGLAWRVRTQVGTAGLTDLVAEAFVEILERLDTSVDIDNLSAALQLRWAQ